MRLHAASLCGSHLTAEAVWDQDWAAVVFPAFSWIRSSWLGISLVLLSSDCPGAVRTVLASVWTECGSIRIGFGLVPRRQVEPRPVKTGLGTCRNQFKCLCMSFFGRARTPHSGSCPDWPSSSTTYRLRSYRGSPYLLSQPTAARAPGGTWTVRDQNMSVCVCVCVCAGVAFRWFCWGNRMDIADCLC